MCRSTAKQGKQCTCYPGGGKVNVTQLTRAPSSTWSYIHCRSFQQCIWVEEVNGYPHRLITVQHAQKVLFNYSSSVILIIFTLLPTHQLQELFTCFLIYCSVGSILWLFHSIFEKFDLLVVLEGKERGSVKSCAQRQTVAIF